MKKTSGQPTFFAVFVIGPFCKNNSKNFGPLFVIRTKVRALNFIIGRNPALAGLARLGSEWKSICIGNLRQKNSKVLVHGLLLAPK